MKDFIRKKLLTEIDDHLNSLLFGDKIEIDKSKVKFKVVKLNDEVSFQLYEPQYGLLGTLRTKVVDGGLKVGGVTINPKYHRQGLATGLYNFAIHQVRKENKTLFSDNNQQPETRKIWLKLVSKGVAEQIGECQPISCLFRTL